MLDRIGADNPDPRSVLDCERWEALLADKMDAADGTLAPEDEAAFVEHSLRCPGCAELFEQAKQGREWLKLLEGKAPAAPVHLLSKILARTQGAGHEADYAIGAAARAGVANLPGGRWGIPFLPASGAQVAAARGAHNARMLMTAGMAFFSLALTLSVAGVRLTSVHAAELRPQAVQANVSRSFYGTKKQVISFYENLRLVYEVESKMQDLRRDEVPARRDRAPAGTKAEPSGTKTAPASKSQAAPGGHAAAGESPIQHGGDSSRRPQQVEQVVHGWPLAVEYIQPNTHSFFDLAPSAIPARQAGTKASDVSPASIQGAMSKERNRI